MAKKFVGECERCRRVRDTVIASAFNEGGTFRHLCTPCDRIEFTRHQPKLFKDFRPAPALIAEEQEPEPEPQPEPSPQLGLFEVA